MLEGAYMMPRIKPKLAICETNAFTFYAKSQG